VSNPYTKTRFLISAGLCNQFPEDSGHEVVFAGRSNTGKSSVINTLCHQKALARTSKTPGRTQTINFFETAPSLRLVDLPGYGFAKVPKAHQRHWQTLMECYFNHRQTVRGIVLIMDIRHPLTDHDRLLLDLSQHRRFPVHILLNKADKLKRGPALDTLHKVGKELANADVTIQLFSAMKKVGLSQTYGVLDRWLQLV
jgi:GTP-binding protein